MRRDGHGLAGLFDGADDYETVQRVRNLPIPRPSIANPRVTPQLDAIVMKALERDPTYRWKSAAEMRDALRDVIAQPGNYVDNTHITEWVKWVFTQQPGQAPQQTGQHPRQPVHHAPPSAASRRRAARPAADCRRSAT